jgi:Tol biopolymer transport system component
MSLSTGTRLGSYEIVGALGAGGMGEVYRARDTKLGRDVAIKILPESVASDPDRVARFQREAQVLAALNHPHIAAIYGLEDAGPVRFIAMEFVDGESLADRLVRLKADATKKGTSSVTSGFSRTGLPLDEALAIVHQIVDALEAAHEKGIVHRDLKPANIMMTADGQVKVLDFGLAKQEAGEAGRAGEAGGLTHSPTLTFAATQAGMILGTAAYMSPEQARGRPADKRSDVWAFGCVLYEMLSGRRAFDPSAGSGSSRAESSDDGESISDVIAAILRGEPDWSALSERVPPAIAQIVKRCLVKDRQSRIPDMSVVRFMMADAMTRPEPAAAAPARITARRFALVAVTGVAAGAIAAAAATWVLTRPQPSPRRPPARFAVVSPAAAPINVGAPDRSVVIAPDGMHVAIVNGVDPGGGGQLTVRALDQLDPVPLRGVTTARSPFFSPDGRWIGYFDTGELKKVPITGGPPISICRVSGGTRGSTWGPDNTIVFATNALDSGLFSVSAGGGEAKLLTKPDTSRGEVDHFFPSFLPDGRHVLFTIVMTGAFVDNGEVIVLDLPTGQRKTVLRGGTHAEYVAGPTGSPRDGYLLYASGGALRAVRFDRDRLDVLSDPVVVLDQLRTEGSGAAQFSVSHDGTLVYVPGGVGSSENRMLTWVDRNGREQSIDAPPRMYQYPRLAADGTHIAVSMLDQEQDVWVLDPGRQPLTRLTFGPSGESNPVWTPDMRHILFSSTKSGIPNVFWQLADGTGNMEQLTSSTRMAVPHSVSPDGKLVAVGIVGGTDIGVLSLDGSREVRPLITTPGIQSNPEISPDGHYLAYQSGESGQNEIYVRPFPNVEAGRWQISSGGGVKPAWARSGQELFYLASSNWMMSAPVRLSPTFSFSAPVKLFQGRYFEGASGRSYDVAPDGKRFLLIKYSEDRAAAPADMVVVLDWFEELRQRLPPKN